MTIKYCIEKSDERDEMVCGEAENDESENVNNEIENRSFR